MYESIKNRLKNELESIKNAGRYKSERIIESSQSSEILVNQGKEVLNFCANNYLGLSSHPLVIDRAKKTLDTHGFGMSSVRFICGTQDIHKQLEEKYINFFRQQKIQYYMLLRLTLMVVFSNHYLIIKTQLLVIH